VLRIDRLQRLVLRLQSHAAALTEETLHRRLVGGLVVAGECNDDVSVSCGFGFAHNEDVAFEDPGVDHRVALDTEQEVGAAAHELLGHRDVVLDVLLGEIAAGGPLLAAENVEEYVAFPEQLVRGGADFLLRVKGDSMIDAGIFDGDLVVVRRSDTAVNGDIVVALAGADESADEATVKRYFRENGRIRLQPENETMEPIYARHVQVLGKVVGVFRSL